MRKKIVIAGLCLLSGGALFAQQDSVKVKKDSTGVTDSAVVKKTKPAGEPKEYKEIITESAVTRKGFLNIHQVEQKYFFEIPDSLFGRDLLVVNRISKSSALVKSSMSGFAGDQINEMVIRFIKGNKHKVYIAMVSFADRASDSTGMYQSVLNSNFPSYLAAFDVKAYNKDSVKGATAAVIELTDYLNTDNEIFYFNAGQKRALGLGAPQADRSFVSEIKAFPMNIEIKAIKTYLKSPILGGQVSASAVATMELNSSVVLLPDVPMKPRFADGRVGYFSTGYTDYDDNPHGIKKQAMVTRWRLEPKEADVKKYQNGQLVEPKKPIVFYIDPSTPKKWIPYLIAGVNDWQVAFEQAGFKNAIIGKEAPANDTTWSIDDARHSAIVYKPSATPNAMGPHVHDPRSGEIIEAHVSWFHNVMNLLQKWYFIQAGAVDPRARGNQIDDALMGDLIRFVASHEVGHTLGLMHNYGSSSTVPVEKLRDKKWVEANGHTPSIMDYARFNYVAQPEDNIGKKGIYPRIGDYDKWAIEWGYKWMPRFKTAKEEQPFLNEWIIDRVGKNKRLWFGHEMDNDDPRGQNEDLGDDAMLASAYGIKNLQRILPNVIEWTKVKEDGYEHATSMYSEILAQYRRYIGHVGKNIGGIYTNLKTVDEPGLTYENVPKEIQLKALAFLDKEVLQTPHWIVSDKLLGKVRFEPVRVVLGVQKDALGAILNVNTFNKLLNATVSKTPTLTIEELLDKAKQSVWAELYNDADIDLYRRNLQKEYVDMLKKMLAPMSPTISAVQIQLFNLVNVHASDIANYVRGHLAVLKEDIDKVATKANGIKKYHLLDLSVVIDGILNPAK